MDDAEAALREFAAPLERDPGLWRRGFPGKWTAGQHADHVAAGLAATANALERNEPRLRDGSLGQRPRRGPLQALWVAVAVRAGFFPRGGRAPRVILPAASPERGEVLGRISFLLARHRALGERLRAQDRDRLWIQNPFMTRWHYTLPEVLRVHAVHARHHARQLEEIAALPAPGPGAG